MPITDYRGSFGYYEDVAATTSWTEVVFVDDGDEFNAANVKFINDGANDVEVSYSETPAQVHAEIRAGETHEFKGKYVRKVNVRTTAATSNVRVYAW